jgi:hypothetical protein
LHNFISNIISHLFANLPIAAATLSLVLARANAWFVDSYPTQGAIILLVFSVVRDLAKGPVLNTVQGIKKFKKLLWASKKGCSDNKNNNFCKTTNSYVRFEVFTAVTMKKASSGMPRRIALVRTDVSEEIRASIIRVTRINELGTTLAVTSNRPTLRRNTKSVVGC